MRLSNLMFAAAFALSLSVSVDANTTSLSMINQATAATPAAEEVTSDHEYFEMLPILIPVINNQGLSQQVSIVISLEIPTGKSDDVKLYQPRLADAYIQDLYGVLGAGYGMVNGNVLNVNTIKHRLVKVSQHVLGKENVTDVLLQVVQQRPL